MHGFSQRIPEKYWNTYIKPCIEFQNGVFIDIFGLPQNESKSEKKQEKMSVKDSKNNMDEEEKKIDFQEQDDEGDFSYEEEEGDDSEEDANDEETSEDETKIHFQESKFFENLEDDFGNNDSILLHETQMDPFQIEDPDADDEYKTDDAHEGDEEEVARNEAYDSANELSEDDEDTLRAF